MEKLFPHAFVGHSGSKSERDFSYKLQEQAEKIQISGGNSMFLSFISESEKFWFNTKEYLNLIFFWNSKDYSQQINILCFIKLERVNRIKSFSRKVGWKEKRKNPTMITSIEWLGEKINSKICGEFLDEWIDARVGTSRAAMLRRVLHMSHRCCIPRVKPFLKQRLLKRLTRRKRTWVLFIKLAYGQNEVWKQHKSLFPASLGLKE